MGTMDAAVERWRVQRGKLRAGREVNIAWQDHLKEMNDQINACLDDDFAFWSHSVRVLRRFIDQEELSWALTTVLNVLLIYT
jgi:hypothetical protein